MTDNYAQLLVSQTLPRYVGGWRIGGSTGLTVNQTRRPRWLTRVLCRWLLEWEWVEVGRE